MRRSTLTRQGPAPSSTRVPMGVWRMPGIPTGESAQARPASVDSLDRAASSATKTPTRPSRLDGVNCRSRRRHAAIFCRSRLQGLRQTCTRTLLLVLPMCGLSLSLAWPPGQEWAANTVAYTAPLTSFSFQTSKP